MQRMKYGDYGRAGRDRDVRHRLRRDGVLGHRRQGARPARVPAARRRGPRPRSRPTPTAGTRSSARPRSSTRRRGGVIERGYRALKFDPFGAGRFELDHDERMRSVVAGRGGARRGRARGRDPGRDARALRPARGDPGRAGCWSRSSRLDRGAGAAGEPEGAGEGRRAHAAADRDRRAHPRPASSSASCSSCRRPTSSSPTSATSAASWRRASWRRRPRRTTC